MKPKFCKSDIVNRNVEHCPSSFYSKSFDEAGNVDKRESEKKRCTFYSDGGYAFKKNIDPRNSYVINNESNLLELCMTISDCDNDFDTPYSILNTVHMTDAGILSSSSAESVVQRRQRKKKRGDSKKRVSFHEDIFKTMKLEDDENFADFAVSFMERKDARCYSWCANGDSAFSAKGPNSRNVKSDCYSNSLFNYERDEMREQEKLCGHVNCQKNMRCTCLSLSERGVPEGQEDPGMNFRPKIEIELEENEAQEAYVGEAVGVDEGWNFPFGITNF